MSRLSEWTTTEDGGDADLGPYAVNRDGLPLKVWGLQQKLYAKAQREPRFGFYALYDRIYRKDVLWAAWSRVAANDGAPGVDGVTIASLLSDEGGALEGLIEELHTQLRAKTYQPAPVRRTYIPKANGKLRPLGIPTVRDRIAQTAAKLVLEPIFEADFRPCSYAYRPDRQAHEAVAQIKSVITQGRIEVLDADLSSYFDTIPHDKLMRCVEKRVSDGSVLQLIRLWLRAPIVDRTDDGPPQRPTKGTPQGSVVSPLLANIYLHWLDKLFYAESGPGCWANARLIRYADDFVICARYVGARIRAWLSELMGRMDLTLNEEKTAVVRLDNDHAAFDFLGFTFRRARSKLHDGRFCVVTPSSAAVIRFQGELTAATGPKYSFVPTTDLIGMVNARLAGWREYFEYGYSSQARRKIDHHARGRLVRHLKRRSQRPYRPPKGMSWYRHLLELGLIRIGARK